MTDPAAPEHSLNVQPSLSRHGRAKSVATASGAATVWAAARSPLAHAAYSARAWPSGDDAGAVVVGRAAVVVVVATVVVDGEAVDAVVLAGADVVGVPRTAASSPSPEQADRRAARVRANQAVDRGRRRRMEPALRLRGFQQPVQGVGEAPQQVAHQVGR